MAAWLNPGSPEAIEQGCVCPVEENNHGAGWRVTKTGRHYALNDECPVHVDDELREAARNPGKLTPWRELEAEAEARRKAAE